MDVIEVKVESQDLKFDIKNSFVDENFKFLSVIKQFVTFKYSSEQ